MENKLLDKTVLLIIITILLIVGCNIINKKNITEFIIFQSRIEGRANIYKMNIDGSKVKKIISDSNSSMQGNNIDPTPSSNGKILAFVSDRDGNREIYKYTINNGVEYNLTQNSADDFSPTWSPDNKFIAFISDRDTNKEKKEVDFEINNIYIMNAEGQNIELLTQNNNSRNFGSISWSPDGKKIAFSGSEISKFGGYFFSGINVISIDDGSISRLTFDQSTIQSFPKWSPDGNQILYQVLGSKLSNIYIMHSDGSNQTCISENPKIYDYSPSWSPFGDQIVFSSRRGSSYHLYKMNIDGSNIIQLSFGDYEETFPTWIASE